MDGKTRLVVLAGTTSALLWTVGAVGTASARSSSNSNPTAIGLLYADAGGHGFEAQDERDLNALEQANAKRDRELTEAIRKSITASDSMSTEARNVTIITEGGIVTLRGTVKTTQEKASIEAMANSAGAVRVHNQVRVSPDRAIDEE